MAVDAPRTLCGVHCRGGRGYDAQRKALRALRSELPEPPRDLWARTAASMDAVGHVNVRSRRSWPPPLAPVAAVLVVAIAVGAGLLNWSARLPGSTTKGDEPDATPIALAAGELQVISRGEDGSVEILSRQLDQVCPWARRAAACPRPRRDAVDATRGHGEPRRHHLPTAGPARGPGAEHGSQQSTCYRWRLRSGQARLRRPGPAGRRPDRRWARPDRRRRPRHRRATPPRQHRNRPPPPHRRARRHRPTRPRP